MTCWEQVKMQNTSIQSHDFDRWEESTSSSNAKPDLRSMYYQLVHEACKSHIDNSVSTYIGWHIFDRESPLNNYINIHACIPSGCEFFSSGYVGINPNTESVLEIFSGTALSELNHIEYGNNQSICHDFMVDGIKVNWSRARELYKRYKRL